MIVVNMKQVAERRSRGIGVMYRGVRGAILEAGEIWWWQWVKRQIIA